MPGGSIETGESPAQAAVREFEEETGLLVPSPPQLLVVRDFSFMRGGETFLHRRHFYHLVLIVAPAAWTHDEMTPSEGGDPILFRLWWMPVAEASHKLGMGMGDALFAL